MENIGKKAKIASNELSNLNVKKRNDVLKIFYKYLMQYSDLILKSNKKDLTKDKKSELIWHKETLGFATAYCTPKKLKIEFYDEKNKLEYSHNIHKQKSNI